MTIDNFYKKGSRNSVDSKSIESFLNFCVGLHENIECKIKHGNSNIYTNFLWHLIHSNKEFADQKIFVALCERFQFEFLLLHKLSKDETIL